jgi:hypothetical protein
VKGKEMDELPDFIGKILVVYTLNPAQAIQNGIALEYVELKTFGNRLFIVGRVPDIGTDEWDSNLQTAVAWDAVQSYLIFDSKQDYIARLQKGRSIGKKWDA